MPSPVIHQMAVSQVCHLQGGGGKWLAYVIYRLLPLLFLFSFTFHNLPLISLSVSSPVSSLDGVREHGMVLPVVQWLGNAEAFTLVFISVIQVNSAWPAIHG